MITSQQTTAALDTAIETLSVYLEQRKIGVGAQRGEWKRWRTKWHIRIKTRQDRDVKVLSDAIEAMQQARKVWPLGRRHSRQEPV